MDSDTQEQAFDLFDDSCDCDSVAKQLGIDIDDAELLYRDWQRRDEGPEPQEEEPIDYDMPDTWAMRLGGG